MDYDWAYDDAATGRPRGLGENVWKIHDNRGYDVPEEHLNEETYDDDDNPYNDDEDNWEEDDV